MAVTQQLARITAAQLDGCRRSVDALDRVCSFAVAPRADHLDLDWAPAGLLGAATALDAPAAASLRRAVRGDAEVNPAYRDHPDAVWEHPVTALDPAAVAEVAAGLRRIDPDAVRAGAGSVGDVADPGAYLRGHLAALQAFYDGAAARGLATVLWWD